MFFSGGTSPKSTSQLVRFRKITEREDHYDDPLSAGDESSDESTGGGCIHWCKKDSEDNNNNNIEDLSGSNVDFKSFNLTSSSGEDDSDEDDYDDNSELEQSFAGHDNNDSDSDIRFEDSADQLSSKAKPAAKGSLKEARRPSFYLDEADAGKDTDDSVIFADNSDPIRSVTSSGTDVSLKSGRGLVGGDSYEDEYDEYEDEEEGDLDGNSKINRQFIYIQVRIRSFPS